MPMPHRRKLTNTERLAASAFDEALPNVPWTRLAVSPCSFRWVTRRCAKTFVSPLDGCRTATTTSTAGSTDSAEYTVAAQPELRLAAK